MQIQNTNVGVYRLARVGGGAALTCDHPGVLNKIKTLTRVRMKCGISKLLPSNHIFWHKIAYEICIHLLAL
jgi:hypothetical protein